MKVAIIAEKETQEMAALKTAFQAKQADVEVLRLNNLGLFTADGKTELVLHDSEFKDFDAVYLSAGMQSTAFVEPLLDQLVEQGVYCQVRPESYYIFSNAPYKYTVLHSRKIPLPKTTIVSSVGMIEQAVKEFSLPVIFKAFSGQRKTQDLVIDSARALKSARKSMKGESEAITIQEYLEGDLLYCFVFGKQVLAAQRKWSHKEFEHHKRALSTKPSETDAKIARKSASAVGADIATVKIIDGRVMNVIPEIDFARFNQALGIHLEEKVAAYYQEVLGK